MAGPRVGVERRRTGLAGFIGLRASVKASAASERRTACALTLDEPCALCRRRGTACGGRTVERQALDAAAQNSRPFGGQGAGIHTHPGDFGREPAIFDLWTAVHHNFEAV